MYIDTFLKKSSTIAYTSSKAADRHQVSIAEALSQFAVENSDYYKQWMFDSPIVVKYETAAVAQELQKLVSRAIKEFVNNYSSYEHLMPVSDDVKRVLTIANRKEYEIGTYRTDFVYDMQRNMRLIEITCRFALNGLFLPAVMQHVADQYTNRYCPEVSTQDLYSAVGVYLEQKFKGSNKIFVLKGEDKRNASKIYYDLLTKVGYDIQQVAYEDLVTVLDTIENHDNVISELALEEIESLDDSTIESFASKNVINDLRTIFLIHDKRFFAVLYNEEFKSKIFTTEEKVFFEQFTIPTYTYSTANMAYWKGAMYDKDNWIIKHSTLGKSQQIYAGIVMSQAEWLALFEQSNIEKMILQQWVPQSTLTGTIGADRYQDYITGTLLYFDDHFFGFGDFRTSSHPVINVVDHRKYCSVILDKNANAAGFEDHNIY